MKKNNISLKIIIMMAVTVLVVMFFNYSFCYAAEDATSISSIFEGARNFLNRGASEGNVNINEDDISDISNFINRVLIILGIIIAVAVSALLGIQFMMGSAEEKAQIKEALIPFVIGCVVIFGAFSIWKIFVTIGTQL